MATAILASIIGTGLTGNTAIFSAQTSSGYDGYDLRHYTRTMNQLSNNQEEILKRFPYICSRQALYVSIRDSGIQADSQRNPNGYTNTQITDFIIDYFDQIMQGVIIDGGNDDTAYVPSAFESALDNGYVWTQKQFWMDQDTSFIFHNGDQAGLGHFILGNVKVVLLPGKTYQYNVKEYIQKPFLGFDYQMMTSNFGAELDLTVDNKVNAITNAVVEAGSFVIGVEYKIIDAGDTDFTAIGAANNDLGTNFTATGAGTGTGVAVETSGTVSDDADNPIPGADIHPSLMWIYDFNWYHLDLNANGSNFGYYTTKYSGADDFLQSTKYYDLRVAKFDVTVSGGKVTAITAASRNDGNGDAVTGGWGYYTSNDYNELSFMGGINNTTTSQIAPRMLYRTNNAQTGYSNNKAELDITNDQLEFYAGSGLTDGSYTAYAIPGLGEIGFAVSPTGNYDTAYDEWFERNWPREDSDGNVIMPSSVRIGIERPTIVSTSRSLKTTRVGTGAHRYSFEFEYAPMVYEDFAKFADAFELAHGSAREIQIPIPFLAFPHSESIFFNANKYDVAEKLMVTDGSIGDGDITIQGVRPGHKITEGFYFRFVGDPKIYRVIATEFADDYGRVNMKVEPNLQANKTGNWILGRNTMELRRNFFLTRGFIVDDTFEYTVDAAGYYRFSVKFVESI